MVRRHVRRPEHQASRTRADGPRVIQISPATWDVYVGGPEVTDDGMAVEPTRRRVQLWALLDDGRVVPMVAGESGGLEVVEEEALMGDEA